jgi:hypothetical protein
MSGFTRVSSCRSRWPRSSSCYAQPRWTTWSLTRQTGRSLDLSTLALGVFGLPGGFDGVRVGLFGSLRLCRLTYEWSSNFTFASDVRGSSAAGAGFSGHITLPFTHFLPTKPLGWALTRLSMRLF